MKKLYSVLVLLGLSLVLISCTQLFGPKPPEPGMVRQVIENAATQVEAAIKQGDAASLAAFYAIDAKLLPPGAPMVAGRPGIQAFWQSFIDSTTSHELMLEILQIDSKGDLAYEMGTYIFKFQLKNQTQMVTEIGKYVTIWERQFDGSWKIIVDTWNTNSSSP